MGDEDMETPSGEGKRLRRVACTCPNCKESGGRWASENTHTHTPWITGGVGAELTFDQQNKKGNTSKCKVWKMEALPSYLHSPSFPQGFRYGEEEAAHLPHRRLRQGLREDIPPPSSPALAQRRETLRLQLDVLWEEIHQERRAAETQEDAHRWDHLSTRFLFWNWEKKEKNNNKVTVLWSELMWGSRCRYNVTVTKCFHVCCCCCPELWFAITQCSAKTCETRREKKVRNRHFTADHQRYQFYFICSWNELNQLINTWNYIIVHLSS